MRTFLSKDSRHCTIASPTSFPKLHNALAVACFSLLAVLSVWAGSTLLLFTDMLCKFKSGSRNGWMKEHEAVVTAISHILGLLIWSTDLLCLLCGSGPVFLLYLSFLSYVAGEQRSNPAATETHSVSSCWGLFLIASSCSSQNPTGPQ